MKELAWRQQDGRFSSVSAKTFTIVPQGDDNFRLMVDGDPVSIPGGNLTKEEADGLIQQYIAWMNDGATGVFEIARPFVIETKPATITAHITGTGTPITPTTTPINTPVTVSQTVSKSVSRRVKAQKGE